MRIHKVLESAVRQFILKLNLKNIPLFKLKIFLMKAKYVILSVAGASVLALLFLNEKAKKQQPKVFYTKKLPGNFNAQTIPPFGVFINESQKDNHELLNHELIHWQQYQKMGLFKFYLKYLKQYNQYGYDKMPMELEARRNESKWVQDNYTQAVQNGYAKTVKNKNFRR